MATSGDGKYSGRKRHFQHAENEEEPQSISQEAGQNNSSGVSEVSSHRGGSSSGIPAVTRISELVQMIKQMTFTRSEFRQLIALLHSRKIKDSTSNNFQASTSTQDSKLVHTGGFPKTLIPQPTTIENLPDVLLSFIFFRLLAKQLAQMRRVSKSWNALLSHPSFIKFHLKYSIHNRHPTLLHFSSDEIFPVVRIQVDPNLQLSNFTKLPVNPQPKKGSDINIIGAVNGLICSSYNNDSVIQIWNPSLSAVLTLPKYSMPPYSAVCKSNDWLKVCFRFGYDPKTEDYKLVKLTGFADLDHDEVLWWMDVEIYSMRKGCWELINERFPSYITWIDEHEVVSVDGPDGHVHWIGCTDEESNSKTIVAFDFDSETFSEIPLPHSTQGCISLGVLAGKLCVMSWDHDHACEVFVMEEYGVDESWVKRHVFSQFGDDTYPFGFTSGNKFLIEDKHCHLFLYDPVTQEEKIVKNDSSHELYQAGKIVEYVDSLVWVAPPQNEMVDDV